MSKLRFLLGDFLNIDDDDSRHNLNGHYFTVDKLRRCVDRREEKEIKKERERD